MLNIPIAMLTNGSDLVITSVTSGSRYEKGVKTNEIETKIGLVAMNNFYTFTVKPKNVPDVIKNLTEEEILEANTKRNYFIVGLEGGTVKPYANQNGYGVSYAVSASGIRLIHDPRKSKKIVSDNTNDDDDYTIDIFEEEEVEDTDNE